MRAISRKVSKKITETEQNKKCALCGSVANVQWHHVWIYAGRQINEPWAIVGACKTHHDMVNKNRMVKEFFEEHSLKLATDEDLAKYKKKDWKQIKSYLQI